MCAAAHRQQTHAQSVIGSACQRCASDAAGMSGKARFGRLWGRKKRRARLVLARAVDLDPAWRHELHPDRIQCVRPVSEFDPG